MLALMGFYVSSKELGLFVGLAAAFPPSPPHRRLDDARRLGLFVGLAAMFPPSPPRRRPVAASSPPVPAAQSW